MKAQIVDYALTHTKVWSYQQHQHLEMFMKGQLSVCVPELRNEEVW